EQRPARERRLPPGDGRGVHAPRVDRGDGTRTLEPISQIETRPTDEREAPQITRRVSAANEPRERSEPAQRRASDRVGESERRSPSNYEASERRERATGTERTGAAASE